MAQHHPPHILAVDDDPRFVRSLARLIRTWGFDCVSYDNGRAALAAIREDPPDLLLVDIFMPEPDGFEVISELRDLGIEIPIVAVSGDVVRGRPTHMLAVCEQLGVTAALRKPLDPERLRALLIDLLASPGAPASATAPADTVRGAPAEPPAGL